MGFSFMLITLLSMALIMNQVNALLYTVKVDMFAINRAGIIALNKDVEKRDGQSISKKDYYEYFRRVLKYNYDLDDNLESGTRLIRKIDILEYEYYKSGETDTVSLKAIQEPTLHAKIRVEVVPIVLKAIFKDMFKIEVHQDVKLEKAI